MYKYTTQNIKTKKILTKESFPSFKKALGAFKEDIQDECFFEDTNCLDQELVKDMEDTNVVCWKKLVYEIKEV